MEERANHQTTRSKERKYQTLHELEGITLLSVVREMLCRIIFERITSGVDDRLRKEQAGYRKGRGTTEQVFILRNIIEQVNKW